MRSLDDFSNAKKVLDKVLLKTGLIYSRHFSEISGNNVYLKPENMQLTGSFKVRGAFYKISQLSDEQRAKGLVASSAGNHAQGVAYAAKLANASATIVMPVTAPLVKVNNTKSYGANVVLHGEFFDAAFDHALRLSKEEGYEFIHPFNDLDVATGQGTIVYEILKDLPDCDVMLIPIGGGGLLAGMATLAKMLKPTIKIIGVEPTGAASMYEALKLGKPTTLPVIDTIADGVAVKTAGDMIFPYIQQYLDDIILVDDSELIEAFMDITEVHKMIVETSGLLSVAALKRLNIIKGKNVVSLLSGGNMDVISLPYVVEHGLIQRGRIFTFSVLMPDRPGELVRLSTVLAQANGNVIRVDHNPLVNINRNAAVGIRVKLEAFGHDHKNAIIKALVDNGYEPHIYDTNGFQ